MPHSVNVRGIRRAAWVVCLLPALWLLALTYLRHLGPNPISFLTNVTGLVALRLLLMTLAVTPAYRLFRWRVLPPLRRVLGLSSFYYGCAHLAIYLVLNQYLQTALIVHDLTRPYILAGYLSWVLAVPLALTSTDAMMRRLGWRWKPLHRLVYAVAIAAVLHYALLLKIDFDPAIRYGMILGVLLGFRIVASLVLRRAKADMPRPKSRSA